VHAGIGPNTCPNDFLAVVSNRIIKQVYGRVVYGISSKPPALIEWQ